MDSRLSREKVMALLKRRGLIFQSSEIYGGLPGCWDYGPIGAELKNNLKQFWWRAVVHGRADVVGFDGSVLMLSEVWWASEIAAELVREVMTCRRCGTCLEAWQLSEQGACPVDGGEVSEARPIGLLLTTALGTDRMACVATLRAENAQSLFVNFVQVQRSSNRRIPFGVAQIGRVFLNESAPGPFGTHQREFDQMDCVYFTHPDCGISAYEHWCLERRSWYDHLGLPPDSMRLRIQGAEDMAPCSVAGTSLEFRFPWGWEPIEQVMYRADNDLARHMRGAGKDLSYSDDLSGARYVPHAVVCSACLDRVWLAVLCAGLTEEVEGEVSRTVLHIGPRLAPWKVAVLPLSKREDLCSPAREVAAQFRRVMAAAYDETASIGKRYRRQDEIGTPICVTIDFETLQDHTVTIRDRDTMSQERVPIQSVVERVRGVLALED